MPGEITGFTKDGLPIYTKEKITDPIGFTKDGLPLYTTSTPPGPPRTRDESMGAGFRKHDEVGLAKQIGVVAPTVAGLQGGPIAAAIAAAGGIQARKAMGEDIGPGQQAAEVAMNLIPGESIAAQGVGGFLRNNIARVLGSRLGRLSPSVRSAQEEGRLLEQGAKAQGFIKDPEMATLPESGLSNTPVRNPTGQFTPQNKFTPAYNDSIRQGQEELTGLVNKGYDYATKRFNAPAVLNELEKNGKAYSNIDPIAKNDFKEFLTSAINEKPLGKVKTNEPGRLITYAKNSLILHLPAAAMEMANGNVGVGLTSGIAGGLVLSEKMIERAMQNPTTRQLMIKATKTGLDAPEAGLVNKLITNSLKGTSGYFLSADDKPIKARVDDNGNVVYDNSK